MPGAAFLFFAAMAVFSVFYLFTGYYHLINWFCGMNGCFYRNTTWTTDFFTGKTKVAGNVYCIIGLVISIAGGWFSVKKIIDKSVKPKEYIGCFFSITDLIIYGLLIIFSTAMWFYGASLVYPSNDEVFSAVNCAALPPFQTIAYYMLPNNHILFNLVNNIIFHGFSDKVATGRFMSLVCYWSIILISYSWLKQLFSNRWLAFAVVIALSVQFPVWGFSTQARGYELQLLAEWGAFISLFRYLYTGHKRWLYVLTIACMAGYFIVPTFLYFHFAIILFALFCQLKNKKADIQFWKFQFVSVLMVFLLYLPCLCFSGLSAISGNKYVLAYPSNTEFIADIMPMINNYMDYCFFNFITSNHQIDMALFLLPLCLFFYRRNRLAVYMSMFYLAVWLAVVFLTLNMRFFPIDRALAGQFSITLVIVIYTVYLLTGTVTEKLKLKIAHCLILIPFLAGLSLNFFFKGRIHINHYLCHFPVNSWYDMVIDKGVNSLPRGCSVAFSDESFYLYYLCAKNGIKTVKCSTAREDYFINLNEPFPPGIAKHYEPFNTVGDYFIYKKK